MESIRYVKVMDIDEHDRRLALLHENVKKYGTVFNTVAPGHNWMALFAARLTAKGLRRDRLASVTFCRRLGTPGQAKAGIRRTSGGCAEMWQGVRPKCRSQ